jgi:hypothetical protein
MGEGAFHRKRFFPVESQSICIQVLKMADQLTKSFVGTLQFEIDKGYLVI